MRFIFMFFHHIFLFNVYSDITSNKNKRLYVPKVPKPRSGDHRCRRHLRHWPSHRRCSVPYQGPKAVRRRLTPTACLVQITEWTLISEFFTYNLLTHKREGNQNREIGLTVLLTYDNLDLFWKCYQFYLTTPDEFTETCAEYIALYEKIKCLQYLLHYTCYLTFFYSAATSSIWTQPISGCHGTLNIVILRSLGPFPSSD